MKNIKTNVVIDPMSFGETAEEEVEHILSNLRLEGFPVVLSLHAFSITEEMILSDADLLVIDYGGMSYGAQDMATWNIRAACQWTEDHPGKLLLIWTSHTQAIYESELRDEFGHLTNIAFRFATHGYEEDFSKLKAWYAGEAQ